MTKNDTATNVDTFRENNTFTIMNDVEIFHENYTATGKVTPAGGQSYHHNTEDSCATLYPNVCIKVYTNRTADVPNKALIPALFNDVEIIRLNIQPDRRLL